MSSGRGGRGARGADRLSNAVNNLNLGASDDGPWEAVSRRNNGRGGGRNPGIPWNHQPAPARAWGQPDTARRLGMNNGSGPVSNTSSNARDRPGPSSSTGPSRSTEAENAADVQNSNVSDEDEEDIDSDDDDYLMSDDSDEDEVPTHETKKQHKMLRSFFVTLDNLTVEEVSKSDRQYHCPACQNGPGAIDWYIGLQPLVTHAKTKGNVRVKLHRMFAGLLEEELRRKGTSAVPAGEAFGQWAGLQGDADRQIVWPPMVIVRNTVLEKDDNEKWIGMGNQELIEYFKEYAAVRAKHSYGPTGHRGLSVLIFDGSAMGYVEAERLHKHFISHGTGRTAWEGNRGLFYEGGKRLLYGFLARQDDIEEFNRHCPGKTRLKYDMRSYKEKVVDQMKQMSEENQQLTWYKSKAAKEQGRMKVLEESLSVVSERLRKTMEQNRIVRQRTTMQHEQHKEEMDFQKDFFDEQIRQIHEATSEKENLFEKLQQEERKKVEEAQALDPRMDNHRQRAENVSKFKEFQEQEMEKFVREREALETAHEQKKLDMKKKHGAEQVQLEKDFDTEFTKLMEKYAPGPIEGATSGDRA